MEEKDFEKQKSKQMRTKAKITIFEPSLLFRKSSIFDTQTFLFFYQIT